MYKTNYANGLTRREYLNSSNPRCICKKLTMHVSPLYLFNAVILHVMFSHRFHSTCFLLV